MSLSDDQFHGLVGRMRGTGPGEGGFSIHAGTGVEPSSGWMVSDHGAERTYKNASAGDMKSYVASRGLASAPAEQHFGGWREHAEGGGHTDYLDTSRNYADTGHALNAMRWNNQKSMFSYEGGYVENRFHDANMSAQQLGAATKLRTIGNGIRRTGA